MVIASIAGASFGTGSDPAMHAPDGFLSVPVADRHVGRSRSSCSRSPSGETNRTLDERAIPLMGVTAAFIFAAQMFNFQVIGGTSGHLLGGVLAAVLLGPGRHARDGLRHRRPGARLPGRRARRDGREHLQHGHRRHARRLLRLPGAAPGSWVARSAPGSRRPGSRPGRPSWPARRCMAVELAVSARRRSRSRCRRWSASTCSSASARR